MSNKLELKEILAAIDLKATEVWEEWTEEQQKQVAFYLLIRYCSSVKGSSAADAVTLTNERYNKHYFTLAKHPKLLWHLACSTGVGNGNIKFHEWIGYKKKESSNKKAKFLEQVFPNYKQDEIAILEKITSNEEFKTYAKNLGYSDQEIKKLF